MDSRDETRRHITTVPVAVGSYAVGSPAAGPVDDEEDANGSYVPLLNQVIGPEGGGSSGMESMGHLGLSRPLDTAAVQRQLLMTETLLEGPSPAVSDRPRVGERRGASSSVSGEGMTEDERLKRRRQINRNSQRRIRERRAKELEELRSEFMRVRHENDQLHRQNECIAAEKTELLRQLQEITEKWQQTISENAILNREILQLKAQMEEKEQETEGVVKETTIKLEEKGTTSRLT